MSARGQNSAGRCFHAIDVQPEASAASQRVWRPPVYGDGPVGAGPRVSRLVSICRATRSCCEGCARPRLTRPLGQIAETMASQR